MFSSGGKTQQKSDKQLWWELTLQYHYQTSKQIDSIMEKFSMSVASLILRVSRSQGTF